MHIKYQLYGGSIFLWGSGLFTDLSQICAADVFWSVSNSAPSSLQMLWYTDLIREYDSKRKRLVHPDPQEKLILVKNIPYMVDIWNIICFGVLIFWLPCSCKKTYIPCLNHTCHTSRVAIKVLYMLYKIRTIWVHVIQNTDHRPYPTKFCCLLLSFIPITSNCIHGRTSSYSDRFVPPLATKFMPGFTWLDWKAEINNRRWSAI